MKNKPKFTGGEWRLDGTTVEATWGNGESVMVCQAGGTRWGGCPTATEYNKRMREENKANAALISAAPEMYEALVEVEAASRMRRPIKKAVWLKVCEILKRVDGVYR